MQGRGFVEIAAIAFLVLNKYLSPIFFDLKVTMTVMV